MRRGLLAVWEFVVGDDPWTALGVLVAVGLTGLTGAWWVMAAAMALVLAGAVWRSAR